MNLHEIKKETEKNASEVFKKHNVFFAFGNDQVNKGIEDLKQKGIIKDSKELTHVFGGAICPKVNVKEYIKDLSDVYENGRKKEVENVGAKTIIKYELANHEFTYTYDLTDTLTALEPYNFSSELIEETVKEVLRDYKEE